MFIHFLLCRKFSPRASSIFWRARASQCSVHQNTGPCLAWYLVPLRIEFKSPVCRFESKHSRPWSVFSSPFHPFTPSHRFRAKWIWFSKYSFAGSVLGLLMSDGNCFCYFPKWKSTSEEQLVCCNVLLPPITSPIPPSQSKPGLDCFICEQGLWDMAGEMCWWQGNGIRELLCALLYLRETGGGRG